MNEITKTNIKKWAWISIAVLACCAPLAVLCSSYMPFIADDALISLRYAERLIEGRGLTWTDGPPVEGYSNFLWTVFMAFLGLLGMDLIDAARAAGMGSFVLLFAWLISSGLSLKSRSIISGFAASLTIASSSIIAVWCVGGLEQPFVALFLGMSLVSVVSISESHMESKAVLLRAIPAALLCITRPEGPLFAGIAAVVLAVTRNIRVGGWYLLPSLCLVLAQLLFRLFYYGDVVPNTAYIKVAFSAQRLKEGLSYVSSGVDGLIPVLILSLVGVAATAFGHLRRAGISALLMMVCWTAYVVVIGGDIFPAYRHMIPIQVTAAFLILIGFDWVVSLLQHYRIAWTVPVLTVLIVSAFQFKLQRVSPEVLRAVAERWEWDGEVVGSLFHRGFKVRNPLVAVTAAGCIGYFSKLPALDLLGLCDQHIAKKRPRNPGVSAHDHGDGKYALDNKPDIILMNVIGGEPMFVSGEEMKRDTRFNIHYRSAVFEGYTPFTVRTVPYIRIDGEVGIRDENGTLIYPGYLLQGVGAVGIASPTGGMTTRLPAGTTFSSLPIPLAAGRYVIGTAPQVPGLAMRLTQQCGDAVKIVPGAPIIELKSPCTVSFDIATQDTEPLLTEIRFKKLSVELPETELTTADPSQTVSLYQTQSLENPVRIIGGFERPEGWRCEGGCDRWIVEKSPVGQSPVTGNVGKYINTFDARRGDAGEGVLISPDFVPPKNAVLNFFIGGGKKNAGLRAVVDGQIVQVWTSPEDGERLTRVRADFLLYEGKTVHLEIFDNSRWSWGHTLVDEIVLYQRAK